MNGFKTQLMYGKRWIIFAITRSDSVTVNEGRDENVLNKLNNQKGVQQMA